MMANCSSLPFPGTEVTNRKAQYVTVEYDGIYRRFQPLDLSSCFYTFQLSLSLFSKIVGLVGENVLYKCVNFRKCGLALRV